MNEGSDADVRIRTLSLELFYNINFMGTERHPLLGPGTRTPIARTSNTYRCRQVTLTIQKQVMRESLPLLSCGAMPSSLA